MNILSWNCRGLGNLEAVLTLHNLVKTQEPKVLFLMETKLDSKRMEGIRVKLRFKLCFSVPSLGRSGDLAMLSNDPVGLSIQNFSQNHIDSHVQINDSIIWRFTGFYGHPEGDRKKESWALLDQLHSIDTLPWLSMGDFNEILSLDERSGEGTGPMRHMQDFGDVIHRCGFIDLGFPGLPFTWENRRDGTTLIQKRLDRDVANVQWMDLFNLCTMNHVVCSHSDHVPLNLHMDVNSMQRKHKLRPRKFEEKWALHPNCEAVILAAWNAETSAGSPMFVLCEKIKKCRESLYGWFKGFSSNFQTMIQEQTSTLTTLLRSNDAGLNNEAIVSTKAAINSLLLNEELHWRQRS